MITVHVRFDLPRPLPLEKARELFRASAPTYREVAGLVRKYYTLSEDGRFAGGIYLWRSRAHAERFYAPEWTAMVTERYGTRPELVYLETPVVVDNVTNEILAD